MSLCSYYKKGKMIGELIFTTKENHKLKSVNCLALVSDTHGWLTNISWRTNHFNKAHKELIAMGYEEVHKCHWCCGKGKRIDDTEFSRRIKCNKCGGIGYVP